MSCGGGDSAALVERLPGDARALSAIDLAAVKERLGLPGATDPTRPPGDAGGEAEARLFAYAGGAFPYLARFDRTLMQAIDESRVTQAASTPVSGPDAVVVLATDQPFDDGIASRLERAGYRLDAGLLVNEEAGGPGGFAAVGGEDGVVVLAGDARAARRALDGGQPGGPTRELFTEIDAPVRDASSLSGGQTCVRRWPRPTAARETERALMSRHAADERSFSMRFSTHQSPLGPLLLAGDEDALTRLEFARDAETPDGWQRDAMRFSAEHGQLDEYFSGTRTGFDFPLRLEGAAFDRAVWAALREIPYGTTASYGEIAARIGKPGRARAVGAANARNPIAIVVPCHRVIGAHGALTGYGGGLDRKRALLALEGSMLGV